MAEVNFRRGLLGPELAASRPSSNGGGGGSRAQDSSYDAQTSFDTNMVIILAALLCALVGALGLNSIIRCVMGCTRRFVPEAAEQAAARLSGTGLKKRALRRLPVAVYGTGGEAGLPATECPICLGEFVDGEKVRVLPKCNHSFHVRCIDTWLVSHSSCPNCRHSLLEMAAATTKAQVAENNNILSAAAAAAAAAQPPASGSDDRGRVVVVVEPPTS